MTAPAEMRLGPNKVLALKKAICGFVSSIFSLVVEAVSYYPKACFSAEPMGPVCVLSQLSHNWSLTAYQTCYTATHKVFSRGLGLRVYTDADFAQ